MKLYKFRSRDGYWGLAREPKGARLPRDGRQWDPMGAWELGGEEMSRIGLSLHEIRERLLRDGVLIWPSPAPSGGLG